MRDIPDGSLRAGRRREARGSSTFRGRIGKPLVRAPTVDHRVVALVPPDSEDLAAYDIDHRGTQRPAVLRWPPHQGVAWRRTG